MTDSTADGARSGTTITKVTTITKTAMCLAILASFAIFVPEHGPVAAVSAQKPQPKADSQTPVFRGGAHLVTVDAYPTQGGKVIRGLRPADFEVFEDGKPQTVANLDFVDYDTPLPDEDRPVMLSAREGLELAADPRYRVIVFVLDRQAFDKDTWPPVLASLVEHLRTSVEPRDLVGLVTTDDPWESVVLGRRLSSIEEEITNPEWLRTPYREDALVMAGCGMDGMQGRVRAETTFALLEGLVRVLGQVREDHSSIVFVSNGLPRIPANLHADNSKSISLPRTTMVNGRIQRTGPGMHETYCNRERARLNDIDFDRRFSELTKSARASNVSFYPIGVWNPYPAISVEMAARGMPLPTRPPAMLVDSLVSLAKDTDGFLVPPMGDVAGGLRRMAGDVGTHYLLAYYTNNTKWDGRIRSIRVRLKRTGAEIRARAEYRAPTVSDIAGLSAPRKAGEHVVAAPVASALSTLSAARPSAQFFAYGAIAGPTLYVTIETPAAAVDAGRWQDGAAIDVIAENAGGDSVGMARGHLAANGRASLQVPLDGSSAPSSMFVRVHAEGESVTSRIQLGLDRSVLAGDPLAFRSSARGLAVPAAAFVFARDERLRLEWPVLGAVDRYEARLLDRYGLPLKFRMNVENQPVLGARRLISTLPLSSLGHGDYVVELTVFAGEQAERHYLAFRIN